MVDFTVFSLFPIAKSESFLSYHETWIISASVLQQKTNKLVIYIVEFCLLLTSNRNKEFYFSLLKLEQYPIIILLFQSDFFSCRPYLIFSYYTIMLFTIVHFMGLLASDYSTNLCNYCSIFWVMIVCEEIFVYLQTIWQGCVGVPSLLHECSVSLWAEYVSVLFLMLVCLQIWWRWVIALWVKIDRDIGKLFNLKLLFCNFWKRGYFYDIFLTLAISVSKTII